MTGTQACMFARGLWSRATNWLALYLSIGRDHPRPLLVKMWFLLYLSSNFADLKSYVLVIFGDMWWSDWILLVTLRLKRISPVSCCPFFFYFCFVLCCCFHWLGRELCPILGHKFEARFRNFWRFDSGISITDPTILVWLQKLVLHFGWFWCLNYPINVVILFLIRR